MVVVAIVGILAAIGVPAMGTIVTQMRMDQEINDLQRGLNFARSEAIKRGVTVTVCPGTPTTTTCAAGQNWSGGWVVTAPGQTVPLLYTQPLQGSDVLGSTSIASTTWPQFTSMGYTFFSDQLYVHDAANTTALRRCLIFSAGAATSYSGSACQ